MTFFLTHFTQHVGLAFAKQLALADYLGKTGWEADVLQGTITFTERGTFPAQILGSESQVSETWLWAWANAPLVADLDPARLRDAERVRAYGEEHAIPALTQPTFPFAEVADGHMLSLLAVGICGADCYYRGPYTDGAAYFLLYDVPIPGLPLPVERIATTIARVIALYPVDHGALLRGFFDAMAFTLTEHGSTWQAVHADGRALTITFDDAGRIAEVREGAS